MNKEKIKIAKILKSKQNIDIDYKDIIIDLKAKSIFTYYNNMRIGCYWDNELKTVLMFGDIDIAQYFITSLIKILKG